MLAWHCCMHSCMHVMLGSWCNSSTMCKQVMLFKLKLNRSRPGELNMQKFHYGLDWKVGKSGVKEWLHCGYDYFDHMQKKLDIYIYREMVDVNQGICNKYFIVNNDWSAMFPYCFFPLARRSWKSFVKTGRTSLTGGRSYVYELDFQMKIDTKWKAWFRLGSQ